MESLRAIASGQRPPERERQRLVAEFARLHRRPAFAWSGWAAAAAIVALAAGLALRAPRPSAAADDMDGFVAVPYAAPVAPGEFLRVIRTELYVSALDRMGITVPAASTQVSAEVVLGQDGLPRAVRVIEDESN